MLLVGNLIGESGGLTDIPGGSSTCKNVLSCEEEWGGDSVGAVREDWRGGDKSPKDDEEGGGKARMGVLKGRDNPSMSAENSSPAKCLSADPTFLRLWMYAACAAAKPFLLLIAFSMCN